MRCRIVLGRLRALANEYGTRLAGAETQVGLAAFQRLGSPKLLDVVMPDIKYCGGFTEMDRIAAATASQGMALAPHNPTGPVCNMATVHACAVARNFLILEYQLAESPLSRDRRRRDPGPSLQAVGSQRQSRSAARLRIAAGAEPSWKHVPITTTCYIE